MADIDLSAEQQRLYEAEHDCMASIRSFSEASAAFVDMIEKLQISPAHPRVRAIMARIPEISTSLSGAASGLAQCHRLAQELVNGSGKQVVQMAGGGDKGETGDGDDGLHRAAAQQARPTKADSDPTCSTQSILGSSAPPPSPVRS